MKQKEKELVLFKNRKLGIAAIVIVALVLVSIAGSGLSGYLVYTGEDTIPHETIQDVRSALLVSDTKLSTCNEYNDELLGRIDSVTRESVQCSSEMDKIRSESSGMEQQYADEIRTLQEELDSERSNRQEVEAVRKEYESLANNTANNICCKARVDNPNIGYFRVENNRIICSEDGETAISC